MSATTAGGDVLDVLRPRALRAVAAIVLAATVVVTVLGGCTSQRHSAAPPSRIVTIEVGGMVCAACVAKVHDQLARVPGVRQADVDLASQRAKVVCDATVADTALTRAVRRAGSDYVGFVVSR